MDIDVLINILTKAKKDELKILQILVKENDIDSIFSAEDITGVSYNFDNDSIILLPEYF